MAAAAVLTTGALLVQIFVGLVWAAKADNLRAAALALETGVDDEEWVSTLHPLTAVIYTTRALLVAQGAWKFGNPRIGTGAGAVHAPGARETFSSRRPPADRAGAPRVFFTPARSVR